MKIFNDIFVGLKKRLWPISPPSQDFIEWCKTSSPENATSAHELARFAKGHTPSAHQLTDFFNSITKELSVANNEGRDVVVDINININIVSTSTLSAPFLSPKNVIRNFSILGAIEEPLKLDSLSIRKLLFGSGMADRKVVIENSLIKEVYLHQMQSVELDIRNTYIGKLVLSGECLKRFYMHGGGIMLLDIQPPGSDNPFTGSIWFADTWFPTEKNMVQGPQPYRNMRHHLRSLSNMQMADLFHALELRTERKQETWTNKTISYLYDVFSDFGASILRPILWLLLLGCSVAYVLISMDGAVPTHELVSSAVGWQTALLDHDIFAPIARGFYLSFYSITHPLGLFGGQPVLLASSAWLSGLLIIEGIFSATLIALTIFALRRRFKLQAT